MKVLSKTDIITQLKSAKPRLDSKYPIKAMALFGSYAREEQNQLSDVDILVEFNGRIGIQFIDLAEEIEKLLGIHVDLVSRNGIKDKYFKSISEDLIYV